jgi:hypothetical protein
MGFLLGLKRDDVFRVSRVRAVCGERLALKLSTSAAFSPPETGSAALRLSVQEFSDGFGKHLKVSQTRSQESVNLPRINLQIVMN